MTVDNNPSVSRIVVTISIQILNYIKYSLTIPLVFFYVLIIGFLIIAPLIFIFERNVELLNNLLKILNAPSSFSWHGNEKDILRVYGWLSLLFFMVGILIEKIFKINISLPLIKKFKIIILVNISLSLLVFPITYLLMKASIAASLLETLGIFLFGIFATFLAFVGVAVDKMNNFLRKSF